MTDHEVGVRTENRPRSLPGVGRDEHVPIYQAYCATCGWVGDETLSESTAQEQADEHASSGRSVR